MRGLVLLVAGLSACGGPSGTTGPLALATEYDAVGVVRVYFDGLTPTALDTFGATFRGLRDSGGRAAGEVARRGIGATPIPLAGTYDAETAQLQFDLTTGALTSTRTESISIAGVVDDGYPKDDGVGDHLTGFLRAEMDPEVRQGQFLAVARYEGRPDPVDDTKVHAIVQEDGTVEIAGDPGATMPSVGVEILRFTVARADPDFMIIVARDDGSFSLTMTGVLGDVFLCRAAPGRARSDARVVRAE